MIAHGFPHIYLVCAHIRRPSACMEPFLMSPNLPRARLFLLLVCVATVAAETNFQNCFNDWNVTHSNLTNNPNYRYGNLTGLTDINGNQISVWGDAVGIAYQACVDVCGPGQEVSSRCTICFFLISDAYSGFQLVGLLPTVLFMAVAVVSARKPAPVWCREPFG